MNRENRCQIAKKKSNSRYKYAKYMAMVLDGTLLLLLQLLM